MPSPAQTLKELRRLASRYGIALELVDRLTLRPREVARTTGFSHRTVEGWIASGSLPAIKIGAAFAISVADLLRFLENHRIDVVHGEPRSLSERARQEIEVGS